MKIMMLKTRLISIVPKPINIALFFCYIQIDNIKKHLERKFWVEKSIGSKQFRLGKILGQILNP